jgi:hypothetical protein
LISHQDGPTATWALTHALIGGAQPISGCWALVALCNKRRWGPRLTVRGGLPLPPPHCSNPVRSERGAASGGKPPPTSPLPLHCATVSSPTLASPTTWPTPAPPPRPPTVRHLTSLSFSPSKSSLLSHVLHNSKEMYPLDLPVTIHSSQHFNLNKA